MEIAKENTELFEKLSKSAESKENPNTIKQGKVLSETPKYDPNKRYQWQPTDQFVLSGEEFSAVLNTLRTFLARPESQIVLRAERAHYAIEDAIARGVELGFVKEMEEPVKK